MSYPLPFLHLGENGLEIQPGRIKYVAKATGIIPEKAVDH